MTNRPVKTLALAASCLFALGTSLHGQQAQQTFVAATPAPTVNLASTTDLPVAQPLASSSLSGTPAPTDASSAPETDLPNAPEPQSDNDQHTDKQTSRILGIIPNFRAVSANEHLPPQTVKEKFITASEDSFDYSAIVLPAFIAGVNLARNNTPEFGHGGVGYGRYLWHSVVDQTSENYMVEFVVPALTHEDTRYYTLGCCGFAKRAGYALSRAVITRNDSGRETFNAGEIVGAGMAAGLSNLYYPRPERTFSNTADQWGLDVGIDAFTFMVKEFWPDINHYLFHGDKQFQDATPPPAK